MRIFYYLTLLALLCLPFTSNAQCIMPTSVTTSGNPAICGSNTLTLSVLAASEGWYSKAAFPATGTRSHAVGFSVGSKGYVGLGYNGTANVVDMWEFDPIANTWTQKANYPAAATADAVGFGIGTKGYVYAGISNAFHEFDPIANTWTARTNFPGVNREGAVGMSIGAKGYVGLGRQIGGPGLDVINFYEYDFWIDEAIN